MRRTALSLVVATLTVTACRQAPDASPDIVDLLVRDSLGVGIVENGPALWRGAETWDLDPDPVVTIDGDSLVLHEITDLLFLDAGGLAVLNSGSSEVLVFDVEGSLRFRAGGEGDGPGELRDPTSLVTLGDSVGVYDSARRRLSVFGPDGVLRREASFGDLVAGMARTRLIALESAGLVLWADPGFGNPPREGVYRAPAEIVRVSSTGSREASYGEVPGIEVFVGTDGAGFVLFGKSSHGTAIGDRLVVGTAEGPELRVHEAEGALERVIRWPDEDRRITEARVEEVFEEVLVLTTAEEDRPRVRQTFERIPRAEVEPPYDGLLASETHVWVGGYRGPAATVGGGRSPERRWLIFDASGTLAARLVTPEGLEPFDVQGDRMLAVHKDALGVETVRVHRIRP